jgi:hypothetical protein
MTWITVYNLSKDAPLGAREYLTSVVKNSDHEVVESVVCSMWNEGYFECVYGEDVHKEGPVHIGIGLEYADKDGGLLCVGPFVYVRNGPGFLKMGRMQAVKP